MVFELVGTCWDSPFGTGVVNILGTSLNLSSGTIMEASAEKMNWFSLKWYKKYFWKWLDGAWFGCVVYKGNYDQNWNFMFFCEILFGEVFRWSKTIVQTTRSHNNQVLTMSFCQKCCKNFAGITDRLPASRLYVTLFRMWNFDLPQPFTGIQSSFATSILF